LIVVCAGNTAHTIRDPRQKKGSPGSESLGFVKFAKLAIVVLLLVLIRSRLLGLVGIALMLMSGLLRRIVRVEAAGGALIARVLLAAEVALRLAALIALGLSRRRLILAGRLLRLVGLIALVEIRILTLIALVVALAHD
jgi:hypothetical protein